MGNAERTEPLTMIGPKGIGRVVGALRTIAPELPFEIHFLELNDSIEEFTLYGYHISAFRVNHNVLCYGYAIEIPRIGRFHVEKAKAHEIPQKFWNQLQHGQTVEDGDKIYTPDMVLGPSRKGIKVAYCTDTRPTAGIEQAAANSDLFICEGMYAEKEKLIKAKQYKHMTFYEAAELAAKAEVNELWLTHFSPSLVRAESYMPQVKQIFQAASLGYDGRTATLDFKEG